MSDQYRLAVPQCPLCAGQLEERPTPGAIVDVCADCHAVWIDWFDGDLASVAGDVNVKRTIPMHQAAGKQLCPRCRCELGPERLRGHGPEVFRCGSCAGVLVPSAVLHEVVAMGPADDGSSDETQNDGAFARFFSALKRLVS